MIQPGDFSPPCVKCTGVNGAHSLRCPTVNLSWGWYERVLEEEGRIPEFYYEEDE